MLCIMILKKVEKILMPNREILVNNLITDIENLKTQLQYLYNPEILSEVLFLDVYRIHGKFQDIIFDVERRIKNCQN